MQQTSKYKLNLIERDDVFSPDALNQNTQKVEAALDAHEEAMQAVTDDLDQRVKVFEAKQIVFGFYSVSSSKKITLGFTPLAVIVSKPDLTSGITLMAITGHGSSYLKIVEDGFQVNVTSGGFSGSGTYTYIAFG